MIPRVTPSLSPLPSITWDETACPLCGQLDAEIVLEGQDPTRTGVSSSCFAVVRCRNCTLHYTNPRPDRESIGNFYPTDYKPHRRPNKMAAPRTAPLWARVMGRSRERLGDIPWPEAGRLLDFGCGGGSYLKRMADRGWEVTGLDASVGAVREVQEALGLKALVGTLPHSDLSPGGFDVITMWHSLEHVHRPMEILREAYGLLVPGGKLIVSCPNIDSLPYLWFGSSWFGLDLPRHLVHFTPDTLSSALLSSGFRVESMRYVRHSDWLRSSAKLRILQQGNSIWVRPLTWPWPSDRESSHRFATCIFGPRRSARVRPS
jgi:SAM-dependent methyltransferase